MSRREGPAFELQTAAVGLGGKDPNIGYMETTMDQISQDPNIIDWNSPDDPQKPAQLAKFQEEFPCGNHQNLAATMFAPGAAELAAEFHITNSTVEALTVSIYVLGFALGPLVFAPLSEFYGRFVIYHFCNVLYFLFTLGCAFSRNIAMFLVFRVLCGCAASGPMSIGGEERESYDAFAIGPLLGPVIGPVIGGFVSENIGWRWTFRILLILSGVLTVISFIFMRETNSTILLERKTQCLRKETGNPKLISKADSRQTPRDMLLRAVMRPTKMLIFSPIVLLLSLYGAMVIGLVFLLFATFPAVFEGKYSFSAGVADWRTLASVLACDKLLGQENGGTVARPEKRLILMKWFAPITPLGYFLYGWSAYYKTHWIVPILGTFIIGLGAFFVVMPAQIYLVDSFGPEAAASALTANLVVRSPFGAFLALVAPFLYARLGLGWGNSVLGLICLRFTPVPWLFYWYGEYLRTRFAIEI